MKAECPNCNSLLKCPDEYAGRKIKCTNCGEEFIVSENEEKCGLSKSQTVLLAVVITLAVGFVSGFFLGAMLNKNANDKYKEQVLITEKQVLQNKEDATEYQLTISQLKAEYRLTISQLEKAAKETKAKAEEAVKPDAQSSLMIENAWFMGQNFVSAQLKNPQSAKYDYFFGESQKAKDCVKYMGDNQYYISGWVDSTNSFGAVVRSKFYLTIEYIGDDKWKIVYAPNIW